MWWCLKFYPPTTGSSSDAAPPRHDARPSFRAVNRENVAVDDYDGDGDDDDDAGCGAQHDAALWPSPCCAGFRYQKSSASFPRTVRM